jgi:hypothetical protein
VIAVLAGALYVVLTSRSDSLPTQPAILGATPAQFASIVSICFAGVALLCAIVAARWARIGILVYLALSAGGAMALIVSLQAIEPQVSTRPLAHYLQTELAGRTVYLYRNFEEQSSLPFYLQAPVSVIDSRSYDLYWGNKLQANDLLISSEQFEQVLSKRPVALVVMERQRKDFEASSLFAHLKVARQVGKVSVFVN